MIINKNCNLIYFISFAMIQNTLKNLLLIGVLLVTTSYGQNGTGPAPRGSNATTNSSYPSNSTTPLVVTPSELINYTRVCDYPTDTSITLRYLYDQVIQAT